MWKEAVAARLEVLQKKITQPTRQYSHGSQNPFIEPLLHVSAFWHHFMLQVDSQGYYIF
jgi:hypothetical protein